MTFPTPPPDNSGGYMVTRYTNGTDTHRMRNHLRPFDATATFSPATGSPNTTVMAEWTAWMAFIKVFYPSSWTFTLDAIFQRDSGAQTFTELFGWTAPTPIVGTSGATPNEGLQYRASEIILNLKDGFGGRGRIVLINPAGIDPMTSPTTDGGSPTGSAIQKIVDYVSTASKSNIVSHNGHLMASPSHTTYGVNRRLRRRYGYA